MKKIIKDTHAIFTTEGGKFKSPKKQFKAPKSRKVKFKNVITVKKAANILKKIKPNNVYLIYGSYGKPENRFNSILVKKPTRKQVDTIKKLSILTGQESFIVSNGQEHRMYFVNGPNKGHYVKGQGTDLHDSRPNDFFSKISDNKNDLYFTHNFNIDKYYPYEKKKG